MTAPAQQNPIAAGELLCVGIGEIVVTRDAAASLVTYALGSCLGVTVYDPQIKVGAMTHNMLPESALEPEKARQWPGLFVDTGVPQLLSEFAALGGEVSRSQICIAGCASLRKGGSGDIFRVGQRNAESFHKFTQEHGLVVSAADIGGFEPRMMKLDLATGRVEIEIAGARRSLIG